MIRALVTRAEGRPSETRSRPFLRRGYLEMVLVARLGLVSLILAMMTGCSSGGTEPGSANDPSSSVSSSAPGTEQGPAGRVDKILVFVVENHTAEQVLAQMPFVAGLAETYGYADDYYGMTHPSLPNYLAIAGGDTFGVTDDEGPSTHRIDGPSVFGEALDSGATAAAYLDGMSRACQQDNGGDGYAVRHNPWAYFVDERDDCLRHDQPLSALPADVDAGELPTVGFVAGNLCHDAHDCSLAEADDWLKEQIDLVRSGPDWSSGHLAIIVTADEDDESQDNRVLTVVAHPALDGVVVQDRLDHLGLSRALSEVAGVAPLRQAAQAPSLLKAFSLAPGSAAGS